MNRTLLVLVVSWASFTSGPLLQGLEVGIARERITPPLGMPMAGYYHERGAVDIHDDLYARAIVLREGDTLAALVSLDLITTRRDQVLAARKIISARTEIPGDHVLVSATHAHTGPVLMTKSKRRIGQKGKNPLVEEYSEKLPGKIADAVEKALSRLQPAAVWSAMGFEDSLAFNRRFHMTDGSVGWNPGKLNPRIIKAAGPIDPDVGVVLFRGRDERPFGAFVNYAVHLDNVGGPSLSADLPYSLGESLARVMGDDFETVYMTGACGDVNHVNVQWGQAQKGHQNAARMGTVLAGSVLRTWPDLERVGGPLSVVSKVVPLEIAPITEAEIEPAQKTVEEGNDRGRANFMKLVKAHQVLDVADRKGRPFEVEVQVVALGTRLAWVALPGEMFVQLGLDLKLDSPFESTMVAELANGSIGYIPNLRAYPQGNYEVVSARCAAGSGERLIATAVDLLKQLYQAHQGAE